MKINFYYFKIIKKLITIIKFERVPQKIKISNLPKPLRFLSTPLQTAAGLYICNVIYTYKLKNRLWLANKDNDHIQLHTLRVFSLPRKAIFSLKNVRGKQETGGNRSFEFSASSQSPQH